MNLLPYIKRKISSTSLPICGSSIRVRVSVHVCVVVRKFQGWAIFPTSQMS